MFQRRWRCTSPNTACTDRGEPTIESLALVRRAWEALSAKKGEDLRVLDVRGLSTVTDYYLIATGLNTPHLKALAEEVERALKAEGVRCFRRAGVPESAWMALDYLDAVVHLFSPETRAYYALEQLWSDAKRVALD